LSQRAGIATRHLCRRTRRGVLRGGRVENGNGAILQQPNIFVSVDAGDGTRVIHRVAAGTLALLSPISRWPKDQRVGVSNRGGEPNLDTVLGRSQRGTDHCRLRRCTQGPDTGKRADLPRHLLGRSSYTAISATRACCWAERSRALSRRRASSTP
jgi:hypothetical protein